MNLLVINFEMDDESRVLAWQTQVVSELAMNFRRVVVLTNRLGLYSPPTNVRVVLFPKFLFRAPFRFFGGKNLVAIQAAYLILRERLDACFVHMNMEWCYRLSPAFRALEVPVVLWYAHGSVSPELHRALKAVDAVVTSTPEGFRIPSEKVRIIGQGIDMNLFPVRNVTNCRHNIVTVSRISRRKRLHLILDAMKEFVESHPQLPTKLVVIGETLTDDDRAYLQELQDLIVRHNLETRVELRGGRPRGEIAAESDSAFVHINLSDTGSMDKTIVEALATGCPVLTSNVAAFSMLSSYPEMTLTDVSPGSVATRMWLLYRSSDDRDPVAIRSLVAGRHDLQSYCSKVTEEILACARDKGGLS